MLDLRKDVYIYTLTRVQQCYILRQRNYSDARRNEVGVLKFKERDDCDGATKRRERERKGLVGKKEIE